MAHSDFVWVPELRLKADWVPGQQALFDNSIISYKSLIKANLITENNQKVAPDKFIYLSLGAAVGSIMTSIECYDKHLGRIRIVITPDHHFRLVSTKQLLVIEL